MAPPCLMGAACRDRPISLERDAAAPSCAPPCSPPQEISLEFTRDIRCGGRIGYISIRVLWTTPPEPERTSMHVRPNRRGLRWLSDRAGADFDTSGRYAA